VDNKLKTSSCAIVVTYNPDVGALLKLLGQLNKETDFLVIDNGSVGVDQYEESVRVYNHCQFFLKLGENKGLAEALNVGLREIMARGYEFALLFDQDSSLCDMYVNRMMQAYKEVSALASRKIAALGPRIINPQTRRQTPFKLFNRIFLRTDRFFYGAKEHYFADFLITSGTLLPVSSLPDIGLMKASYFIDNVDLEWCFRAKSLGYDLAGTDQAVLYHAIGERSENPLVQQGLMAQHKPARTYYSSRNRIDLYGRNYAPLGWKLRDCGRFFLKACWLLLASHDRKLYWKNISAGIRDSKDLDREELV